MNYETFLAKVEATVDRKVKAPSAPPQPRLSHLKDMCTGGISVTEIET